MAETRATILKELSDLEYDPRRRVDPDESNAMGESERIDQVERYHRRKGIRMPSVSAHAAIHAVVQNQIAMGDAFPAKAAFERLMAEGLSRHEAVHALGSIVAGEIYRAQKDKTPRTRSRTPGKSNS
jgi:uncharacterized protein YoaH (UPF0181 family)